jgi:hypothetical protein
MVTFKGWSKFFARNSGGKYEMDVDEIRSAFLASGASADRIRDFHLRRVETVRRLGLVGAPMTPAPSIIGHLAPLDAFSGFPPAHDLRSLPNDLAVRPLYTEREYPRGRFNLDGFQISNVGSDAATQALQIYRDGVIEFADQSFLSFRADYVLGRAFERVLVDDVGRFLRIQRSIGVSPPVALLVTLTMVQGRAIMGPGGELASAYGRTAIPIDRTPVRLPDVLIPDYDVALPPILRPMFDSLWQAGGWTQSPGYDQAGQWERPE